MIGGACFRPPRSPPHATSGPARAGFGLQRCAWAWRMHAHCIEMPRGYAALSGSWPARRGRRRGHGSYSQI